MQDPAQERIKAEESAKPQPGATIGRDASFDPVVLNPNIDIPKYDGTEDPRPWIESLEEIGFLYHWADYIISRYAAMNMTGSAKTWLNLHKASFTSWENIKIRLIQDFSLDANKEELRMKLNRMQHWNEPAIRFAEDILVLCNKVDPAMEEETKIEHVIGGLKKEYSFALYLNPPKTTDDLLVVCKKMDSFEKKYRERVEKSRNLYKGPRYSRPQQQSRYVPPTAARNYQTTSRPQAPVSNNYKNDSPPTPRQYRNNFPQPSTPRRPYNPNFVPKPNLQRNTYNKSQEVSKNRTEDGRPICFKSNKPGHVARYCRVKFIRILEEDPADTQEKVEEKCQMNEISEKSGPRLYADIGTFEALVDTGADLSVVDLRTALDTGHGISKLAKICAGPDGKKLDMVGSIFLNIKIDDETLSHNFVILKTHLRTLILGRDFLKKMNAKIDCKQETIKYDLTNNHDEINFERLKIKSAKDSIVPECSMKLIKASVETEDGEYIIEESIKMFQTNGLRLARSLINVINRETHIWITNPYPRPLKIMKNQTLAFGSSPAKINVSREREVEKNEEPRFQINENLSPKEQKELKQVLERYGDLFSSRLGRTNLAKHRIDTEDAKPIKHKPYRVSAKERDIIKEQIDEMLTEGIIRPSSSPWSFPVILVKKRDGKYRFCVDYRKLNNVTVKDVYPIPRIDEVMDTLQGSTHFSAIDLRSGYWQVEVEERDKEKTAFTTAHGLYEFNVMPFGLCNAPATFERNMENMLGNLRWQICLCYLDDVIIYSPDFPTHLKRLEAVFRCFRESNLRLNDKKCRFAFEELEILGYITSKHGIKPAEHNIKAVRNFPRPKKVKEVQSFLGMCSYYRKFIKDFSKIADPLTNLIKKSVSFTWTERQEEAFQTLKTALLSPPILGHFNPNAPTYVHTDASNIGIGATLVQDIGGEEKVISYLSRTLSKAEQNYSTTEKECLAVVWSMSKLRPYLYGRHFKIVTDHHALCWLKNLKDPTGRLARWALKIQEYDFDIIHKSGKKHLDADGLSRGPLPETDWDEDFERLFLNQITDEEDKFIESVKKNLNGSRRSIAQNFKEEDGCLFKKNPNPEGRAWLLVVPENKKREIMKEYHNHMSNGHLGVARTMYRIKSKYFWPSMLKDVSEFVKTCHLCQSRKGSNQLPSGLLQPIPPANFPFERIGIDFVGPLPSTKNRKKWIIVLTDYYTRYAETRAVSEATVKEVSKFLVEDIFLRHGAPQYLISDRGSQFTSNLMKEVMKTCKIKHCFTTSYHPQTNGLTERLNRTLINMLSMYVNTDQKNWDEILPFITHAYNTTIQETTGYSPFFLMFGREPTSLLDDRNISVDIDKDDYDEYIKHHLDKINRTRKLVIDNTIKTQERMKKNYDKKHMERSYEPGELVAVWTPIRKIGKCEKLLRKYFGPYRILKKLSNVNYLIEPKDNPGQDPLIVHVSRLKPYFERIDEVTHEDRSRQDYLPKTRHPKMENQARSDATSEGNTTPSIVTDIVAQLAVALRDIVNPGQRDSDLPRYDGTYPAANFFQQYDDIADRAYLTGTKRLQKLPAQLSGEPLTFFRQLDLANKSYDQARQVLIDLYPGTVEVSFSKFLALKLTPQTTLQGYYKEKTAMGLQLNLPTGIILESLTEGLPTADQRLVRTVSPNTLKDWHDLMARIKAPRLPRHADSSVPSQPPSPCHYCRGNHWNAQCPRRQPSGRNNVFYQETTGRQPRTSLSTARSQPARSAPSSDTTVQTTPRSEEIGDISSAFWQVEIEPSSRNLLAFVTLEGQYQFSRLPFGLKNSPQIYERALSQVIQKYELDFIAHYFDDFVIFSNTIEEHAQHIQKFFLVCQEENIKLNYNKCEFFKTQIEFLGYTIKSGTYTPQIKNLDVINAIKVPTNLKTLQSFLGAINVYNKFIPNYAQLRTPLNKLLKKDTTWNWDNQCQTSFEALKESLTSQPILHLFKEGLPCQLYCDASLLGIAGVLKQQYPDGTLYPVQFYSRALRPHKKNYTISELECLAIIECVDKFRVYLTGVKFTIFTDHHALQWLKTIKNPTGRLFRWSLKMSTYEYEIRYIKGSKQHEADLLLRNPFCGFLSAAQIKEKQPLELPYPNATINPEGLHTLTRKGVTKVIVPPSLQHTLINKVHVEYNHPGVSQMTRIISTQYTWRGMTHSIAKYVKSCPTCQLIKRPKGPNYGILGQLPPVSHPFDTLSIDTIAGFSKYGSSKTYLHVIVDHLSRYAWTFPSKSTSTLTYLQCLKKVMQSNTPKCLLSDRAPAFTSPKFRRFLLRHGIQPLLTTSNNPQANGLCERLNATLTGKLRILHLENPKVSWIKLIKTVTDKYNQTPHTITGFPPSFLMYNIIPTELSSHIDPYPPVEEARKIAIKRTLDRHAKEKIKYDSKHRTPQFEVGDIVLVKAYHHPNSGKLLPYFTGPSTILEIISPNVVRINRANQPLNRDNDTVHVNKLKYYTEEGSFRLRLMFTFDGNELCRLPPRLHGRVDIEVRLASGNTGPRGPKISQTPPSRRVDRIVNAKVQDAGNRPQPAGRHVPAAGVRCPGEVDDDATSAFCRDRTSRVVESLRWFVRGAELLHQLRRPSRSGPTTILYKTEKASKPPASTPPSYQHASVCYLLPRPSLNHEPSAN
ncbi:hypothetical protein LAZ67_3004557, partial [Cordylochernes scorpioides]